MDRITVARGRSRAGIAPLHFGNRLLLGHPARNHEVETVAALVRTVGRVGQPLRL